MKKKKLGVITLAITLISLGVLLLLNNFIDIDIFNIFSIIWPCIIILFGLEIIIIRLIYKKKNEDVNISIDTISIVLLIIIIISSSVTASVNMAFSGLSLFKDGIRISHNFNVFYKYDSKFTKDYILESSGKDGIDVTNSFGNVEVYSSSSDKVEINAEINFKHNDEKLAEEISNKIINIDDSDRTIRIVSNIDRLQQERDKIGDISVSYYIKVPKSMMVDVENKFGNVTIDGIDKDANILNSHGNVEARSLGGKLSVENSFGNVDTDKINENVIVNNKHGNINIDNIEGDLTLRNAFGNIEAMNINGSVEIENSHDSILVQKVSKDVKIKGKYGNIETKNVKGKLTIENSNGNITVDKIDDEVNVANRFGNTDISEVSKSLRIVSKNGNINYSTSHPIEKGIDIDNEFGDINIDLPSTQKGSFNIVTEYGNISDRFGFAIKESINEQRINESNGNNEVKIDVRDRNGDIKILAN